MGDTRVLWVLGSGELQVSCRSKDTGSLRTWDWVSEDRESLQNRGTEAWEKSRIIGIPGLTGGLQAWKVLSQRKHEVLGLEGAKGL